MQPFQELFVTEYHFVQPDGSAFFYGIGVFTGSMNGKNGTFKMNYVGRITADDDLDARWVIHDGTGDLANLFGEGSLEGHAATPTSACAMPFTGTYRGQLIFSTPRGR